MKFSVEELYFMYGQYNAFVGLQFDEQTHSYELFGKNGLMGTFKYTLSERKELEKLRETAHKPRTKALFKFIPSEMHNLNQEIKTILDRDGLLCSDIAVVSSRNQNRENRFIVKGEKEIPDKLMIPISESKQEEIDLMTIGIFKSRLRKGGELAYFEYFNLYGLQLFYQPKEVVDNPALYVDFEKKELNPEVKYYFLYTKYLNAKTEEESKTEIEEMKRIKSIEFDKRVPVVINEIKKNGLQISKLEDLDKSNYYKATRFICYINDELILPYDKPIWCDFERLAHIYLGHIKEMYIGAENQTNTFFQYNYKEAKNVISTVLQMVYDEYISEIKVTNKIFKRRGSRAIEFDGHYYRIEIETNGRLLTFHPYNDDTNKDADNN